MNNYEFEHTFRERVEELVAQIPSGRVMTYGQLALLCGNPRAARVVGGIAHFGDPALPWHRVVNKQGGLAVGYPGGRNAHARHLRLEGVTVSSDLRVDVQELLWQPSHTQQNEAPSLPPKLIVIVGETASGKSDLAMELARKYNGELICADSWTVYKGFDIGSAKPDYVEREAIRHYGLDVADPHTGYSAPQFKRLAEQAIEDISRRGKLPILVGGTGLYVDSVLYDYSFLELGNTDKRDVLNTMSLDNLLALARRRGLSTSDIDERNKRRVIRLIENDGAKPSRQELRRNTLILGLATDRSTIERRIADRVDVMIEAGLQQEVERLASEYGWDVEPMKGIGYREWYGLIEGMQTLAETREKIIRSTIQLAKKQRTWFKRNNSIRWVANREEAVDLATTFLNK